MKFMGPVESSEEITSVVGSKVDTILGPHHWVVIIWFPFFKKRRKYIHNKKKIHIKKDGFPPFKKIS